VTAGLIVFYPFTEGTGLQAADQSNNAVPMNLDLTGSVSWNPTGNGVVMSGGRVGTAGAASKLIFGLQVTSESTFEAWVKPANLTQDGPTRIVSVGADANAQNYVLGQTLANLEVRLRHTAKDSKLKPRLTTSDSPVTTQLTHIVHTYDGITERLYINGVEQPTTVMLSGIYTNWVLSHRFNVGNEGSSDRPFMGEIRMVAVYDWALDAVDIMQNFLAGASFAAPTPTPTPTP
jgi:hypothetical protein